MTDRWNPKVVETQAERPVKVFVSSINGGPECDPWCDCIVCSNPINRVRNLSSQHRVTMHPAGFRVRERGAVESTVVHAYRCPVHGVVDVKVPRVEVPDEVVCPVDASKEEHPILWLLGEACTTFLCGEMAAWCGSFAGSGHASGEVTS